MVTVVDLKQATDLDVAGAHEIGAPPGVRLIARALDAETTVTLRAGPAGLLLVGSKHDGEVEVAGETHAFGKRSLVIVEPNQDVLVRNPGDERLRFATIEPTSTGAIVRVAAPPEAPGAATPTTGPDLPERRAPIVVALDTARSALSARVDDISEWSGEMEAAIERLGAMFAEHVRRDAGPQGFLEQSAAEAPRLIHALDRLRSEHAEILDDLGEVRARIMAASTEEAIAEVAPHVAGLLGRIDHHLAVADRLAFDIAHESIGQGD